jgi:hypothetical protein
MSYVVSVRNTKILEEAVTARRELSWGPEISHNAKVLLGVLKYADLVIPKFSAVTQGQKELMAHSVCYLLRPDLVKNANAVRVVELGGRKFATTTLGFGPCPLGKRTQTPVTLPDDIKVHLRNDPSTLGPSFHKHGGDVGAEFFRCFAATIEWMPDLVEKLGYKNNSFAAAFKFADLTAYLLDPNDLVDYTYSETEEDDFSRRLRRDIESV